MVDPDAIHQAHRSFIAHIAEQLHDDFLAMYHQLTAEQYEYSGTAVNNRRLRNICLSYLAETVAGQTLAAQQCANTDNMTDRQAALRLSPITPATNAPKPWPILTAPGTTIRW